MTNKNVYITSASRTAIGTVGKSLKNISEVGLGSTVILDVIKKSKLNTTDIDEVVIGQVITGGRGQNPARQSAMLSGISKETPAYVVNQVCGSGLRSIISGFQSIKSKDSKIVLAGGRKVCLWLHMRFI